MRKPDSNGNSGDRILNGFLILCMIICLPVIGPLWLIGYIYEKIMFFYGWLKQNRTDNQRG